MMTRAYINRATLLLGIAFSLQGCAALFGPRRVTTAASATPAMPTPVSDANTQRGRQLLTDGRVADAIDAFREALTGNENVAPAVNGLGVAYARLGRYDLARRYFAEAMVLDPVDGRYAANLARLDQTSVPVPPAAMVADSASQPSNDAVTVNTAVDAAPGRLRRISSYEVRIATIPVPARPAYNPAQRLLASSGGVASTAASGTIAMASATRSSLGPSADAGSARLRRISSYEVRIATIPARESLVYSRAIGPAASSGRVTGAAAFRAAVAKRAVRPLVRPSMAAARAGTSYASSGAAPLKVRNLSLVNVWLPWNPLSLQVPASSGTMRGNIAIASSNR